MTPSPERHERDLVAILRALDEVLAHFQQIGELAHHARTVIAVTFRKQDTTVHTRAKARSHEAVMVSRQLQPVTPVGDPIKVRLTRRQQQVLDLLVQGSSNRRIGRCLHITEQTVKAHLHMIYHKLGAADRTEAAVSALRLGLASHQASSGPRSQLR
jgi:DNA-binding NarL/FixJ family response regulator